MIRFKSGKELGMTENHETQDSRYIQQHLANERTFLAWLRTSITIVGLGFLAAGVVFRTTRFGHIGHLVSAIVGISAVILANTVMAFATKDYFIKQQGINTDSFRSSTAIVKLSFACLTFINTGLVILIILLLFF
jgi:putative membrane protein